MPKMTEKRRLEWSFFLNVRNRITFNKKCKNCVRGCKQSFRSIILACPHYLPKSRANDSQQHEP